jgi:hypothetical protein
LNAPSAVLLLLVWLLFAVAWRSTDLSWRASLLVAAVTVAAFAGLGLLLTP